MTIRLVLGEDNALLREGMRGMLSAVEDLDLVASCADLPTLLEQTDTQRPDVGREQLRFHQPGNRRFDHFVFQGDDDAQNLISVVLDRTWTGGAWDTCLIVAHPCRTKDPMKTSAP